jgi:phenylpropionate dioxygenase-like ring-hydroxylating dioxygenase large terminal subunit
MLELKAFNAPDTDTFDVGYGPMEPDAVILQTGKTPVSIYTSTTYFERERDVFRNVWLYAGRIEEVPKPGDWFLKDVRICHASIIIVRDRNEEVRAFHNVCSHRSMKLLWEPRGHSNGIFTCPFHAWSYGTDGSLKVVTDEDEFPGLCRDGLDLLPVHVDIWAGFIFINLAKEPRQTLKEFLGPIANQLEGAPFDEFTWSATISQELPANWKLGNESTSEGYHTGKLHPLSARPWAVSRDNPHLHFIGWQAVGPHRVASIPANPDFKVNPNKPIQTFAFQNVGQMVVSGTGAESDATTNGRNFKQHPDINPLGAPDWAQDMYSLFPVGNLSASYNGWFTTQYWPITVDTCMWTSKYYFRAPKTWRERFAMECSIAQNRDIVTEDNAAIREQHSGMKAGVRAEVHFGANEMLCRHNAAVHKTLADHDATHPIVAPLPPTLANGQGARTVQ